MTSELTFYNIPDLEEERNYICEGMSNFLSGFDIVLNVRDFMFQRLESTKAVKLNLSQGITFPQALTFNYCRIDQTNLNQIEGKPAFYFVQEVQQIDKNTVKVFLKLDVLNTFYDLFKENFSDSTYIARAHEERFRISNSPDYSSVGNLACIFDRRPEGDNPPLIAENLSLDNIEDESMPDADRGTRFYLVYRTSGGEGGGEGRPCVDLAASKLLKIGAGSTGAAYSLTASQIVAGRYYYLIGDINFTIKGSKNTYDNFNNLWRGWQNESFSFSGSGFLIFWKQTINGSDYICFKFISSNADENFENGEVRYYRPGTLAQYDYKLRTIKADGSEGAIVINRGKTLYYSNVQTYDQAQVLTFQKIEINAGTYADKYLGQISQIDRTDSRIVKIIECPYCPCPFTYNSQTGIYTFSSEYFPNESEEENPPFLRSYDLTKDFPQRKIKDFNLNDYCYADVDEEDILAQKPHFLKDPKLYTSQYRGITFLYDSFSKQIKLEDLEYKPHVISPTAGAQLQIQYKQSSSVSSALAFDSNVNPKNNWRFRERGENFPRLLAANRNNELALFSSDYLNYMRNGYNYDKKKITQSIEQQGLSAAIQTIAALLSFALSPATGGLSAAAGIGLVAGAVSSAAGMAYSTTKSGEELAQKINLLKAQGFSVSSIDDLSLFDWYQGNRLCFIDYALTEKEEKRIDARFRYYGYAVDTYANPYPYYMTNRHYFNYLKCDPVFVQGTNKVIAPNFLDEISEKLRAGVTIWHESITDNTYQLDRELENIEEAVYSHYAG